MTREEILDKVEEFYKFLTREAGRYEKRILVGPGNTINWKLLVDVDNARRYSPNELEVVPILDKEEFFIESRELIKRAEKMRANLGYEQALYLLNDMPAQWYPYIFVFPGTIWYDNHYCLRIPKIVASTAILDYHYYNLSFERRHRYRLLRVRS